MSNPYKDLRRIRRCLWHRDCDKLVLVIDYTQAALTASMLVQLGGGYHVERALHEPRFGAQSFARDMTNMGAALGDVLKDFVTLPVQCRWSDQNFHSIDRVVIFGDAVDDPQLQEVLEKVLNQKLYNETFGVHSTRSISLQSTSAAARDAALERWAFRREGRLRSIFSCVYYRDICSSSSCPGRQRILDI